MKAELLSCKAVAGMLDISIRQVWRMRDGGLLPAPVKLGGSVRWRRGVKLPSQPEGINRMYKKQQGGA